MHRGQGVDKAHGPERSAQGHVQATPPHPPDLRALDLSHQPRTALFTDSGPRWGRSRRHFVWPLSPVEQDWPRALHREQRLLGWHRPNSGQSPAPRLAPLRATPRSSSLATARCCSEPLPMGNCGQGAVFSRYPPHQADCPPALIPAVKTPREERRPALS